MLEEVPAELGTQLGPRQLVVRAVDVVPMSWDVPQLGGRSPIRL